MIVERSDYHPFIQHKDNNIEMEQPQGQCDRNEANAGTRNGGHAETVDGDERTDSMQQVSAHAFNWVWEQSDILLPRTLMISFFKGRSVKDDCGVEAFVKLRDFRNLLKKVVADCNRTKWATLEYVRSLVRRLTDNNKSNWSGRSINF